MSVSVIIPALNEESTVAGVIRACLADDPLEVLVIDADSTDDTAAVARAAGADVRNWRDILPEPPRPGKGEALWRGVAAARGAGRASGDASGVLCIFCIPYTTCQKERVVRCADFVQG